MLLPVFLLNNARASWESLPHSLLGSTEQQDARLSSSCSTRANSEEPTASGTKGAECATGAGEAAGDGPTIGAATGVGDALTTGAGEAAGDGLTIGAATGAGDALTTGAGEAAGDGLTIGAATGAGDALTTGAGEAAGDGLTIGAATGVGDALTTGAGETEDGLMIGADGTALSVSVALASACGILLVASGSADVKISNPRSLSIDHEENLFKKV
jgi:hypothetical protein